MARLRLIQPIDVQSAIRRWPRPAFAWLSTLPNRSQPLDCIATVSGHEVIWRNADGLEVRRERVSRPQH